MPGPPDARREAPGPRWAEHPDLVDFYTSHRCRPQDLYRSERRFLPWLARRSSSVLDTGCAAGGFSGIWRAYAPCIRYMGIDVSPSLVDAAQRLHPDLPFLQADVLAGVPLRERHSAVVQALGWLSWVPDYVAAVAELWRLADRYLFCDLRVVEADTVTVGRQRLALVREWDGETATPYVIVPWTEVARLLLSLEPESIFGYGYFGKPAETAVGVAKEVCFATFVVSKRPPGAPSAPPLVCLDLPFSWPQELADAVRLSDESLDSLVPPEPSRP